MFSLSFEISKSLTSTSNVILNIKLTQHQFQCTKGAGKNKTGLTTSYTDHKSSTGLLQEGKDLKISKDLNIFWLRPHLHATNNLQLH